jgi:hypothetical protein
MERENPYAVINVNDAFECESHPKIETNVFASHITARV